MRLRRAVGALAERNFRYLFASSTISGLGDGISVVALVFAVLQVSDSAIALGLVLAAGQVADAAIVLAAGVWADRLPRHIVLIAVALVQGTVQAITGSLVISGSATIWMLVVLQGIYGLAEGFYLPASTGLIPATISAPRLQQANALLGLSRNGTRIVGPAIGGAIVAAAGAAAAFGVNAASYIALLFVLARWKRPPRTSALPNETLGIAMAAGLRYVAMSPHIRTVLLRAAVFGLGASSILALLPVVAKHLVSGGPLTYGLLLGAFGVGAVTGALGAARLRDLLSTEAIVRWAGCIMALAAALVAVSTFMVATMAALLLAGAGWVLSLSTFNVSVQLSAPRWVVARALALYQMAAFGGLAAGSWLWGELAADLTIEASLLISAGVVLIGVVIGRWAPLSQAGELNLDPLRSQMWNAPSTSVPVDERTGPVVITVEYLIDESDVDEFLGAMNERRRMRRRDGARNWRLLRDLSDPRLWIERYETPTWLDYIRLNNRATQDDAAVPTRLRELHRGTEGPRVRRRIERQTTSPAIPHADDDATTDL